MPKRTSEYAATLAERRAERAKLLALAQGEFEKARALRLKGGATNRAKALEHTAKGKRYEADAYRLKLRRASSGASRRRGKRSGGGLVRVLAAIGGGE
jgi:hypothetical protein